MAKRYQIRDAEALLQPHIDELSPANSPSPSEQCMLHELHTVTTFFPDILTALSQNLTFCQIFVRFIYVMRRDQWSSC